MKIKVLLLSLLFLLTLPACGADAEPYPVAVSPTAAEQAALPVATAALPETLASDKWALWSDGARLRGANLHPCKVYDLDQCIEPITRQDLQDLRNLNANVINATYPGVFDVLPPYDLNAEALAYLDNLVQWAEEVDIFVVINFRSGPGRNEAAIHMYEGAIFDVWQTQAAHDAWIEQWRFTADRYKDNPVVIGYTLFTEPHPNVLVDPDYEMSPQEYQAEVAGTLMDWNAFAAEITAAIREVDPQTPIIVDSLGWASPDFFPILQPTGDPYTIYSVHAYDPDAYSHQNADEIEISYPEVVHYDGADVDFSRGWLENKLAPVVQFSAAHDVPIFVGEFGPMRWVPGGEQYLADLMTIFEQYGWGYAYYTWRGDEAYFDGFNLEYGPDPENHTPIENNPLLEPIIQRWQQNIDYPATFDL